MSISTGNFDSFFLSSRSYDNFELRTLANMKDTTETVCQRISSETAQQNFVKLYSYEGLNVCCAYPHEILIQFFFWE